MAHIQRAGFWDKSFVERIESMAVNEGVLLWSLSCASFVIRTREALLYLDPYFGFPEAVQQDCFRTTTVPIEPSQIRRGDAALISHAHVDHCHPETLRALTKQTDTVCYGPDSAARAMVSCGLPMESIGEVKSGDRVTVKDAAVTVLPGYDTDEPHGVTYLIESGGVKVFFGGDTRVGPVFDELGANGDLDIAMLAFGSTKFYMDEAQLLDAAERLRPRLLLPYHWDVWHGLTGDALELGRLVERRQPPLDVQLLLIGQYLHYMPDGRFVRGA